MKAVPKEGEVEPDTTRRTARSVCQEVEAGSGARGSGEVSAPVELRGDEGLECYVETMRAIDRLERKKRAQGSCEEHGVVSRAYSKPKVAPPVAWRSDEDNASLQLAQNVINTHRAQRQGREECRACAGQVAEGPREGATAAEPTGHLRAQGQLWQWSKEPWVQPENPCPKAEGQRDDAAAKEQTGYLMSQRQLWQPWNNR